MALNKLNILSILLSLCFACASNSTGDSQRKVLKSQLVLNQLKGLMFEGEALFTGTAVEYYPSGGQSLSIIYKDGKREGAHKKWFENGTLSYHANYENGKKNGVSATWWSNGNSRSKSNFNKGKLNGLQQQWYKSGAKFKALNYNNGVEEGMQKAWRENGKIYNNYEAKHGRIFGLKRASMCFQLEEEEIVYLDYPDYDEIKEE